MVGSLLYKIKTFVLDTNIFERVQMTCTCLSSRPYNGGKLTYQADGKHGGSCWANQKTANDAVHFAQDAFFE